MNNPKPSRSMLTHLSWRFHPRMEELAVAALAYILEHYPDSRRGLNEVLQGVVSGMELSDEPFQPEVAAPDGTRVDLVQEADGEERLFIEAKFHAPLTQHQPVDYLKRLPAEGVSVLMFLAPSWRVKKLWSQLLRKIRKVGMRPSAEAPPLASIDGTGKHLLVTDWTTLLGSMEARLEGSESGLADLRQLMGLVRFAEARERKSPHAGEELVKEVIAIGEAAGWLDTKTEKGRLQTRRRLYGYGRYVWLGRRARLGTSVGFNTDLHEEFKTTPLWVRFKRWRPPYNWGWTKHTVPTLKDRMSPHVKHVGKVLWVGVVPEEDWDPASYAAELERIAEIVDEASEPLSPADVLEEVGRSYDQPVMNNVHRSEYVEAIVALALRDSGWTRKAPWDAWDLEHKSGVRLEVKQSAAAQSWGSGETQRPPRFDIASRTGYWDDKEGSWVPQPGRHANVYVFAWHGESRETPDQRDPISWEFYAVPERDLPSQKTIGLTAIRDLASRCDVEGLPSAVDEVSKQLSGPPGGYEARMAPDRRNRDARE
ncbi:hypothetical protein [Candidatus Palauibacter sp.]|uniref:hypothetical protein n=1 Tax=Candidatus Palauibacter sp. TaxID=3101350 RepID=UPI003B530508